MEQYFAAIVSLYPFRFNLLSVNRFCVALCQNVCQLVGDEQLGLRLASAALDDTPEVVQGRWTTGWVFCHVLRRRRELYSPPCFTGVLYVLRSVLTNIAA